MLEVFFSLIFNRILWLLPFAVLVVLSSYKIFREGIYSLFEFGVAKVNARKEGVKAYGSLNVLLFAVLWIMASDIFSYMGFTDFAVMYLCFCTLFSCYGVSELYARVIWFRQLVGDYSLMSVLKGAMFPVFFVGNHVPLYVFLSNYQVNLDYFNCFLVMQFVHLGLWVVHGYLARIKVQRKGVIKELYYISRALAVSSYIVLLLGFIV